MDPPLPPSSPHAHAPRFQCHLHLNSYHKKNPIIFHQHHQYYHFLFSNNHKIMQKKKSLHTFCSIHFKCREWEIAPKEGPKNTKGRQVQLIETSYNATKKKVQANITFQFCVVQDNARTKNITTKNLERRKNCRNAIAKKKKKKISYKGPNWHYLGQHLYLGTITQPTILSSFHNWIQ